MPYHQALNEYVRNSVDVLLSQQPELDAIVCCDDASALIVLDYLQEVGKRVPNDIALIGFDDVPEAATRRPALTTVHQPMIDMGAEAARMLVQKMNNPDLPPVKKVLPIQLIFRETA